jgi:putative ABC transport system permease protein
VSGWSVALRLAWREARRSRGRAALVIAMIAVPVLGLSYAAVSYDTFTLTATERADRRLGAADTSLTWQFESAITQDPDGYARSSGDLRVRDTPYSEADLLAVLPPGSRVIRDERQSPLSLRTRAGGLAPIEGRGLDLNDPMTRGIAEILDGRAPAGALEVALSEAAADKLDARIGDDVFGFDGGTGWRVVGLVRFPGTYGEVVAYRPGDLPGVSQVDPSERTWLAATGSPVTWPQVEHLNTFGLLAESRSVLVDPPPGLPRESSTTGLTSTDLEDFGTMALVGGLGVLEIVLLAGPAFAVGARTRQRELALIAANGGTPAHLRRVVLADGVVLGAVGAATGVALGICVAFAARPLTERYVYQAYAGGFRVLPLGLLLICVAAIGTGVLAALVPAATAARQPVVAGLTGRRGAVRSRRRWLVLGLAMMATGGALAVWAGWRGSFALIMLGLAVGELGLVLCTPSLLGLLGRLGHRLPLTPRIALRDTSRNRSAAAPAISAVMAAVAGTVTIGVVLASESARQRTDYEPMLPAGSVAVMMGEIDGDTAAARSRVDPVIRAAKDVLGADRSVAFDQPACVKDPGGADPVALVCRLEPVMPIERKCPYADRAFDDELTADQRRAATRDPRCADTDAATPMFSAAVGGAPLLTALTGTVGADLAAAAAVLAAGGAVTTDARYVRDGRMTLEAVVRRQDSGSPIPVSTRSVTVPAYVMSSRVATLVVAPAVVKGAGLTTRPYGVVATTGRVPDSATEERFDAALRAVGQDIYSMVERGAGSGATPALLILAIAAGLITLGAAGVATGLAAVDGRNDLATLGAIGASPGVRRLLSLSQAGVIAGLGTLLGLAAGFAGAYTILAAVNQGQSAAERWPQPSPFPATVPWATLAVLVVVPLVAMLGAGLLTRSRLPIERRPG